MLVQFLSIFNRTAHVKIIYGPFNNFWVWQVVLKYYNQHNHVIPVPEYNIRNQRATLQKVEKPICMAVSTYWYYFNRPRNKIMCFLSLPDKECVGRWGKNLILSKYILNLIKYLHGKTNIFTKLLSFKAKLCILCGGQRLCFSSKFVN